MNKLMAAICFMLAASPLVLAQDKAAPAAAPTTQAEAPKKAEKAKKEPSEAQRAQHQRLKECNAAAGDKQGDERKKFMSVCLKDKQKAQQERLKLCNKEAGDKKLKDDARKGFMKECLSPKK